MDRPDCLLAVGPDRRPLAVNAGAGSPQRVLRFCAQAASPLDHSASAPAIARRTMKRYILEIGFLAGVTRNRGVPVRIRPVQDRHRPVELPHDGADDGRRALPRRDRRRRLAAAGRHEGRPHRRQPAWLARLYRHRPRHRPRRDPRPCRRDADDRRSGQGRRDHRKPSRPTKRISPPGHPAYRFDPAIDLVLDRKTPLPGHANGMAFYAYDAADRLLLKRIYYSIGGGFVVSDEELQRHEGARRRRSRRQACRIPSPTPSRCWPWRRKAACRSPR